MPPDHPPVAADDGTQVGVQWFGGACFYLHSPGGVAVVTDPFDPKAAGLDPAGIGAHFVTVSSDDPLHGFTAAVHAFQGETKQVVRGTEARRGDLHIIPIEVPSRRGGKVYAYAIEAGALRFAHLGSVGGPLTPQQVKAFGPIDVAMVPVAGEGLSSRQAVEIAKQLNPRIVIPMAHGTPEMRPPASRLPSVQAFVEASPWAFTRLDTDVTMLSKAVLPQTTEIWSLQYGR
jgi:L-ascorbate metabolism protein UlaG (beta-lactamase superfamily)